MLFRSQPIPALLVETAFISNPEEERLLRSPAHQRRVAAGIFAGLKRAAPWIVARRDNGGPYIEAGPAPAMPVVLPVRAAARVHVVKPGETLSAIARLYDIHVDALRFLNDIQGNELAVGTRLQIPGRAGDG